MVKKGWQWCSPKVNAELDSFFKSGAIGYTLMAGPSGVRLTIYDQAVNLNRNVRCHTDIPYAGMFQLQFTCFDSQSGAQIRSQIVGQILGNAIPMWGATVLSNLTAQRAGDTNITTGSQSGAVADAASEGGAGMGPITFNVSATGGQGGDAYAEGGDAFAEGGNAQAGAQSTANLTGGCPSSGSGSGTCPTGQPAHYVPGQ
jgi:hypothetical protein